MRGPSSQLRCVVCLILLSVVTQAAVAATVVTTSGPVTGALVDGALVFKGIPYAAAPVGELRWRPPQPAPTWREPRDATHFGDRCMQPPRPGRLGLDASAGAQNEDCLYLNVWTASTNAPVKRESPVMVWIHGGAFRIGSGSAPIYDGTQFARRGIVLVTLNYRLGRFGFFAHPALAAAHPQDARGNYGLMDQIAALRWVRDNIAGFGGDPDNVTVFGESAGGSSVLHLLTSPKARGLFAKAIVESGGGHQIDRMLVKARGPRESLVDQGIAWATRLGVADDAAALRRVPAAEVLGDGQLAAGLNEVGPVIDGEWIVDDPGMRFARGEFAPVPLLIGTNSYEAGVLRAFGTDADRVLSSAGERAGQLRRLYEGIAGDDTALANLAFGDAAFVAGARHVARSVARSQPVWLYHFDYVLERRRGKVPGAAHGSEIPFVFDSFAQLPPLIRMLATDADQRVANTVNGYWVNFAKSGDPNGPALPQWPRYSAATDELLSIGPVIEPRAHLRAAQLDFFQQRWEGAEGR